MEETFKLATDCLARLIAEDRNATSEEKVLLAKMAGVLLFDVHSIAASLGWIATAVEGLDNAARDQRARIDRDQLGLLLARLIAEDRNATSEEKVLLAKMAGVLLFDVHSIAASLGRIATAVEGLDNAARDQRG